VKLTRFFRKHKGLIGAVTAVSLLLAIIMSTFRIDSSTNEMIVGYMQGLGWKIEDKPCEISHLTLPEEFDPIYRAYNTMQKNSGFDLENFRGKKVTRYSYRVLNHKNSTETKVVAGIYVFENTIIAGDISSVDENGFMHPLTEISNIYNSK